MYAMGSVGWSVICRGRSGISTESSMAAVFGLTTCTAHTGDSMMEKGPASTSRAYALVPQLASVATGVACASVRVPVSMVKSRVQLGLAATPRLALTGALRSGVAGLYVGLSATVGLDIAYALIQFTALEYFRALGLLLTGAAQP